MSIDSMISEVSQKFGLGPQADTLVREVLSHVADRPGGIAGLLDKFHAAGLGGLVSSWVGQGENQPLSEDQLCQSLGSDAIDGIARKVGMTGPEIAPAVAFLAPKVIDHLTPGGNLQNAATHLASFLSRDTAPGPSGDAAPDADDEASGKE